MLPTNGRPVRISKADLSLIRNKLFSDAELPMSKTAYDGEKNIFSAVSLPEGEYRVGIPKGDGTIVRTYILTLKLVKMLELCKLNDYLSGHLTSIPRDILQGMDVVFKENPTRKMISSGRSFYSSSSSQEDYLGRGIAMFRGFQHSLKTTSRGLALCLDYSVLAFLNSMPVLDFLREHIRGFNLNEFQMFRRQVENVLQGLKVYVTHRRTKQKFNIRGLTRENARECTFMAEDPSSQNPPRRVRLLDYFGEKYNKRIEYGNIPCLDLGKNNKRNDVPMECCVLVEGQRYQKENLDRTASKKLKDTSLASPQKRRMMICNMVNSDDGPCGYVFLITFTLLETYIKIHEGELFSLCAVRCFH